MEASAVEVRLLNHDQRLDANHDAIARLRDTSASHETRISVITTEVRETREDIAEIRKDFKEIRDEQKAELLVVRRGLWAAAGTFLLFFVAAAGLLVQISGHG